MAESQTIVVRDSSDLAGLSEFEDLLTGKLDVEAVEVMEDPDEISREIIRQLLAATTDEELALAKATKWRDDLLGVPVLIRGFRWRKSDYLDQEDFKGMPVYALTQGVRLDTGEYLPAITCGSANVLAQLANLGKRGKLPGAVWRLVQAEDKTKRGFQPLWLEKVPDGEAEVMVAALSNPLLEDEPTPNEAA